MMPIIFGIVHSNANAYLKLTPEISFNEVYTDNVELMPRVLRQSEMITEIVPTLTVSGQAPRKTIEAQYLLQAIHYNRNRLPDKIYQRGNVHYDHSLWHQKINFFVDGVYTQQVLFPESQAFNTVFNSNSQSNVATFQLGPDIEIPMGRKLSSSSKMRYGQTHYISEDIPYAKDFLMETAIRTGSFFRFFRSTLEAKFRQTSQTDSLALQTTSLNGIFQYSLFKHLQLLLQLGYENTNNQRGRSNSIEGLTWYGGFSYSPTKRTQLSLQKGERSFGGSTIFNAAWFRKRHEINVSYDEDITTSSRQQIDFASRANLGNSLSAPSQFVATFNEQILISKKLDGMYSYHLDRSTVAINIFQIKEIVLNSSRHEKGKGVNFILDHQFNSALSLNITSGYVIQKFFNGEEDKRLVGGFLLVYQPTKHFSVNAGASHFNDNSENFLRNTYENLVSIGFRVTG